MSRTLESALETLNEAGLNVFASMPVKSLPAGILQDLEVQDIRLGLAKSIVLVGHGGRELWSKLAKPLDSSRHPIDQYTRDQILLFNDEFLHDADLQLLYPHPKWNVPLQKLGRALNVARPSKLGLDIHPRFGPWFAYRAAFLTSVELPPTHLPDHRSACETCAAQPCVAQCPSGAVRPEAFRLTSCVDFRLSSSSACLDRCLSRLACPVGREHQYSLEQLQYHMLRPAHLRRLASYGARK
jgi:hypothetical protein